MELAFQAALAAQVVLSSIFLGQRRAILPSAVERTAYNAGKLQRRNKSRKTTEERWAHLLRPLSEK